MKTTATILLGLLLSGCYKVYPHMFTVESHEPAARSMTRFSDACYEEELIPGSYQHYKCMKEKQAGYLLGDSRNYPY